VAATVAKSHHTIYLPGDESTQDICAELNGSHAPRSREEGDMSLAELSAALPRGEVSDLLISGGNPVYNTPATLDFAGALKHAGASYRLGLSEDETSAACTWHLPAAHSFESWSDAEAANGVTFAQPLIAPLLNGKSLPEVLSLCSGKAQSGYEILREHWHGVWPKDFAKRWAEALREGHIAHAVSSPRRPRPVPAMQELALKDGEVEIVFRADPCVWDGRFANNPWLQELPKPLSLLTWENTAWISAKLARDKNLVNGQKIELTAQGRKLQVPVWIMPGQEDRTVTLFFGYGRTHAGKIGSGLGYNAYALWTGAPVLRGELARLEEHVSLASTQTHGEMSGEEDPVRRYRSGEKLSAEKTPESLYPEDPSVPRARESWGMVIDLDSCTGCSACMIACQSENNIPVVGKKGVLLGRQMHWIRVDRYFSGDVSEPRVYFQPVPCMQCEKAPCEVVCPVAATTHSSDGLNQMVYNRCVGTRYCANNCPYKVRRFNYLAYNSKLTDLDKMGKNPEVSVRSRGVMEKCTYCVQRIEKARIHAKIHDESIPDGAVRTACQATCPTEAISFGNLADPDSQVSRLRRHDGHYALLEHLGTRPRTTYLGKREGDPS
jgi:molybdopterin-containing oxidoreductase family iron-sulfur binding subunit